MATPINRDFTRPVSPKQRVSGFVSGLGDLVQGLRIPGAPTPQESGPAQVALQTTPSASGSAVQASAQRRMDAISSTNSRLKALTNQIAAQKAAQQAFGGRVAGTRGAGGGLGNAWKPDGSLSDARNKVLQIASSYLGTPYVLGGTSYKGIDCSGLVMMVYNQLGFNITRHSATWQGKNIPGVRTNIANLRPGDIVAWKDGSHIAIYAGNGEIIEAANPRRGTLRRKLWANPNAVYGIALRLPGE